MRIVGGDLALDFANTVDGEADGAPGFDYLRDYEYLVAWSRRVGLVSEEQAHHLLGRAEDGAEEAGAVHGRAMDLREAVGEVFRAVAEGEAPPPVGMEVLHRYEVEALARGRLMPVEGRFDWGWTDEDDLAGMLWPVAHAATGLLTSDRLGRVKRCAACWWLFVDASKNQSRRWCTMEDCGTAEKMRRYIARRAARRKEN